jgi:hypothetical protein
MQEGKTTSPVAAAKAGKARVFSFSFALAAFLASALDVHAGSVSASLSVSVIVPARAVLSIESQPAGLQITEADVARGYVEAPGASLVRVRTNSPGGWLLEFQPLEGPYRALEVSGLGSTAQVSASGGWLAQPYAGKTLVTASLGYRFFLSGDAQPGLYPWPVALTAIPR